MSDDEAVAALNAIDGVDGERAHCDADDVLLAAVSPAVRAAYMRAIQRASFWAYA